MNVIGYARVSKREQNPAAQEAELRAAGVAAINLDLDVDQVFVHRLNLRTYGFLIATIRHRRTDV